MSEKWLPIDNTDGYEISDLGNARSPFGPLKLLNGRRGYLRVGVYKNKRQRSVSIAPTVLTAFVGPRPTGAHAAHLNGVKTDNRLSNLAWVSPKTNSSHKLIHKTQLYGEKHNRAKYSDGVIEKIRSEYVRHKYNQSNAKDLAKKYGVPTSYVKEIIKMRIRLKDAYDSMARIEEKEALAKYEAWKAGK